MATEVPPRQMQTYIGKPGSDPDNQFKLKTITLQKATEEKDIGVIIDSDLSFERRISEKVNKANCIFVLLRRTFQFLDTEFFVPLYKTLVRTHLEFASSVWHPYKSKYIEMIENVQRRATVKTTTRAPKSVISREIEKAETTNFNV